MTTLLTVLDGIMVALITGSDERQNDVDVVVKTGGTDSNSTNMGGLVGHLSNGGLVIVVVILIILIFSMCCCAASRWLSPYLSMGRALQERRREEEEARKRELALIEREEREVKARARQMILGMKKEVTGKLDSQKSLTIGRSQEEVWRGMEANEEPDQDLRKAFRGGRFSRLQVNPDTI